MSGQIGEMAWLDLSVPNAEQVKEFYQQVIGWQSAPVSMGEYDDFTMISPPSGKAVAGVCHAKGGNAELPPVWLPYFLVADIEDSVAQVLALGGQLVGQIKQMGSDKYAVITDPAGASCALYQKGQDK